jgi:hypothetical protein
VDLWRLPGFSSVTDRRAPLDIAIDAICDFLADSSDVPPLQIAPMVRLAKELITVRAAMEQQTALRRIRALEGTQHLDETRYKSVGPERLSVVT